MRLVGLVGCILGLVMANWLPTQAVQASGANTVCDMKQMYVDTSSAVVSACNWLDQQDVTVGKHLGSTVSL